MRFDSPGTKQMHPSKHASRCFVPSCHLRPAGYLPTLRSRLSPGKQRSNLTPRITLSSAKALMLLFAGFSCPLSLFNASVEDSELAAHPRIHASSIAPGRDWCPRPYPPKDSPKGFRHYVQNTCRRTGTVATDIHRLH